MNPRTHVLKLMVLLCLALPELKALDPPATVAGAPPDKEQLRQLAKLPSITLMFRFGVDFIGDAFSKPKSSPAALAAEIAAARKMQAAHPGDAACYVRLGDLYDDAKNTNASTRAYAKASGLFHKQLESQPNDAALWIGYGKALRGADRPDEGEAALRQAVKIAPQNGTAWTELGEYLVGQMTRLLLPLPNYHDELPFQKTIAEVTQHPPSSEALAKAQRLFAEAGDCFDKGVAAAPQSAAPYLARYGYRSIHRSWLRAILEKQPVSPMILIDPDVMPDLRKAAQLDTEDYHTQVCCALFEFFSEVLRQKLDLENQRDMWQKLPDGVRQSISDTMARLATLAAAPDKTKAGETLEALGTLQFFIRQNETQALANLRRAVTLDPTREQAWDMLTGIQVTKHTNDLVAICQQRLEAVKSARNHVILAKAWDLQGQQKEVEAHVHAAIKLQPKDVLANLAQAALSVRRSRDAATLGRAARDIAATAKWVTDATPHDQQAELATLQSIHAALSGHMDKANQYLDRALRLDPNNSHVKDVQQAFLRAKAGKGDPQSQNELGNAFFFGNLGLVKDEAEAAKWWRKAAEQDFAAAQNILGWCYITGRGVTKDEVEAVKWCRKAAEQNYSKGQYALGDCYANGRGVAKDDAEAAKWYRKAAEQNLADAQCRLGLCYVHGRGVAKDLEEAVKWYRKAAEQNQAEAQRGLGWCYATGQGVAKDGVEAVKWYRKAAEQNNADAQYSVGYCYAIGVGVTKDDAEAVKWYRKAAEQNQAKALCCLGLRYASGRGVAKDDAEAAKWYRKAAEQNDAEAQYNLGLCYAQGCGVAKDEAEAVKWYRKAAGQNYADAQYGLGYCYAAGEGVTKDDAEAVRWYRKAAEQNQAKALCCLGLRHASGLGVAKDDAEAAKWFRKAAEQNDAEAQYILGLCYAQGCGVAKDEVEAVKWYRKAAGQNQVQAQFNLGCCYDNGRGVTKDEVEAVKWYHKAAEQNDADAQNNLAWCYARGSGVAKDEVEAVKWWRKAAEQNDADAQCSLGNRYSKGKGVKQDVAEGYKWTLLAARQGDETAKKAASTLEGSLTAAQVEEGKRRADDWTAQYKSRTR